MSIDSTKVPRRSQLDDPIPDADSRGARPLDPCELEIDLFCRGARIGDSCRLEHDARQIARTRAGLGSGLELVIPGPLKEIWLNVPINEPFARWSPYLLEKSGESYFLRNERSGRTYPVRLPEEPTWYGRSTSKGTPMSRIGVLQGTYLGVYISDVCLYWRKQDSLHCKFCTTGLNVGTGESSTKSLDEVVEVARAAKEESGITFVHFNTGYHYEDDPKKSRMHGLDQAAPYVKAMREKVGVYTGVQVIPALRKDFWKYDWLIDCGADHFSFCYELHDPEYFAKFLPGKDRTVGREAFFEAMEYTSRKLGKGRVSGEIIAGIEPIEKTLEAIDYITSVGAFPTVCVFRPLTGSDLADSPPPKFDDMLTVFRHVYDACRKNGIPIGVVPNIEVSLVVTPDDTRYLAPGGAATAWYEAKLAATKTLARSTVIPRHLRPSPTRGDAENRPEPAGLSHDPAPHAGSSRTESA